MAAEALLQLGIRRGADTLVCAREDGETKQPMSVTHEFTYLAGRAGAPRVRLHDLRHSHATQFLPLAFTPRSCESAWPFEYRDNLGPSQPCQRYNAGQRCSST